MGHEQCAGKKGNRHSQCHQKTGYEDSANTAVNQYMGKTFRNERDCFVEEK